MNDLLVLKAKIEKLSLPDKLRLAAGLIEQGKALSVAEWAARRVADELALALNVGIFSTGGKE